MIFLDSARLGSQVDKRRKNWHLSETIMPFIKRLPSFFDDLLIRFVNRAISMTVASFVTSLFQLFWLYYKPQTQLLTFININYRSLAVHNAQFMASLHQKHQLVAKRQNSPNRSPKNKKQKDSIGIDSFDSFQFQDELSPFPTFAQHANYFAQSSISQKNEETFSFEIINKATSNKKAPLTPNKTRQKEKSPSPASNNRLHKIQQIVKDINNKHKEIKLNLFKIKNTTTIATTREKKGIHEHENKLMLTLRDKRNPSPSPRYKVQGNMTQRQAERLTARNKVQIARKIEKAETEMKECTFRPNLIAKKKSDHILATRVKDQERTKYLKTEQNQRDLSSKNFIVRESETEKKKYSTFKYSDFRNIIKCELLCLDLLI